MNVPAELKYTKEHEWIRVEGEEAYVGITDYAQSQGTIWINIHKIAFLSDILTLTPARSRPVVQYHNRADGGGAPGCRHDRRTGGFPPGTADKRGGADRPFLCIHTA